MGTVHPFELSHGLLGIQVNHFNLGAMGDIEPPCGLIDGKIILATVTSERDRLQQVVTRIRCREGERNNEEGDYSQFGFHPEFSSNGVNHRAQKQIASCPTIIVLTTLAATVLKTNLLRAREHIHIPVSHI